MKKPLKLMPGDIIQGIRYPNIFYLVLSQCEASADTQGTLLMIAAEHEDCQIIQGNMGESLRVLARASGKKKP